MLVFLEKVAALYERMEAAIRRGLFVHTLPSIVADRLTLVRRFRLALRLLVPVAILMAVASVPLMSAKVLNLAGLLFDLAGIARIFLDEEWERILSFYTDQERYPSGPPSYIVRELMADESPEDLGELDEASQATPMARHLYWQRGLVLVLVGFILQFAAAVLAE